jgi:ribosomal protein L40E
MTHPTSQPTTPPLPNALHVARTQFASLGRRVQRKYGLDARREVRLALFDFIIGPMMTKYAESDVDQVLDAAVKLRRFDESVCPTCKEPRHPKSTVCWKCAHEGMRKSYSANTEAFEKLRSYSRAQRTIVQLAVNTLGRSARQKKKGPFVRQARAILEAALAEPEPGDLSMSLLMKLGIGAVGIFSAMAAYWGVGYYARSKVGARGSTADGLAASP